MAETYVAADCYFSSSSDESKNNFLIDNWNKVVGKDDDVLILGTFYGGADLEILRSILKKLNGNKIIIDYNSKKYSLSKYELMELGFNQVHSDGYYVVIAPEDSAAAQYNCFILPENDKIEILKENNFYGATAKSISEFNKVFQDNILSLSIDNWGYTPIKYDSIPELIMNIIKFDKSEVNE